MRDRASSTMTSEPRIVQREFGKFTLSHGWIQCRSRRYPKRLYFHNVRSGCNTWYRPVSRHVNVPTICVNTDMSNENNVTENSLELVSMSDDEKQPKIRRKSHVVITEQNRETSDDCYALQVGLTVDATDDSYESDASTTFQWETTECFIKNKRNVDAENSDDSDSSERTRLPLHDMKSYRKKRITVSPVLTSSRRRRVVSRPRRTDGNRGTVKRKLTPHPVVSENPKPREIVCDMFGVKTINYFYEPGESVNRAKPKARCSRLSDSDTDDEVNQSQPPINDSRASFDESRSTFKRSRTHSAVSQNREPQKIVCGAKTANCFDESNELADQACAKLKVQCLRLSDSDSDDDVNESPSLRNKSRERSDCSL
ncbi:uncharacterized protein LOC109852069 isoform X2 [Pseudomyrmex gracilis]|uniref:uncharacterized protein LOC109852069 isoform X2 n=1 Tax=Pseudomyrmex gracilis TaxID=219809 RepID=UPI000994E20C|nr:uncharacterized protein LOC109852069 isoform X2 [Pseudomyrmex gracilis]